MTENTVHLPLKGGPSLNATTTTVQVNSIIYYALCIIQCHIPHILSSVIELCRTWASLISFSTTVWFAIL